jgi:hypothetical protein
MQSTKLFVMRLVVEGGGTFPIDMLRYDSCVPADEQHSRLIESSIAVANGMVRQVTLKRFARDNDGGDRNRTAVARWRSFGWSVVSYEPWEA